MPSFPFFSRFKKPKQEDGSSAIFPQHGANMGFAHSQPNEVRRAENYDEVYALYDYNPSVGHSLTSHRLGQSQDLLSPDVWQGKASSTFPTELPTRPQKTSRLRLRKRTVSENVPSKSVLDTSFAVSSPKSSPVSGFAEVVEGSEYHVGARHATSQPGLPHLTTRANACSTTFGESTVTPISDDYPRSVSQRLQTIKRKPVPTPENTYSSKDPLVERSEKWNTKDLLAERFTQLGSQNKELLSPPTTALALPTAFHTQHLGVAGVDLDNMTKNTPTSLQTRRERQVNRVLQIIDAHRQKKSVGITGTENEEGEQVLPISTRPFRGTHRQRESARSLNLEDDSISLEDTDRTATNFSDINHFQKQTHRGTPPRQRRSRLASLMQNNARRSRSPNSSSDGAMTPESSDEVSRSETVHHVRRVDGQTRTGSPSIYDQFRIADEEMISTQEEQDRQLALRIQQEEEDGYNQHQRSFFSQLRSARQDASTSGSVSGRGSTSSKRFSNENHNSLHRGTREDPINLDSDSGSDLDVGNDSDEESIADATSLYDYYGEPMELDDSDPDIDNDESDDESIFRNRAQSELRDAEMARALQEEEDRQHRQTSPNTRECAVCSDSISIADLPSLVNCSHQPRTCVECYEVWITTQLRESSWREVKCPGSECKILLMYHEIQQYASPEIFEQYDTFTARAVFSEDPNFRWCRAEGCKSGQFHHGGEEGNIFTCAACGLKVCIVHEDTWHEGETCDEYEYRRSGRKEQDQKAQEEASLQAIGESSKKCPGPGCVYNIEKNEGCDHMTCSKCGYEFCWICLCNYNTVRIKGNSAHTDDCKYHTKRL